jgi:ubiquinone/menaquinone biosynthesis C-methylase UbiE
MATIEQNLKRYAKYNWPASGEEWSSAWGGSEYLWCGTIQPRIQHFLPAQNVLELAPGYGRCTEFLRSFCDRLALVDLVEKCISACRERFAGDKRLSYHVNDGKTLPMITSGSIDLVFSWDSLVHVEADHVRSYLAEFSRILKPDGVGFVHHSNLAIFKDASGTLTIPNQHLRAETVSAALFENWCRTAGLACVAQEIINWGSPHLIDCISVFVPGKSTRVRPNRIMENTAFMNEAAHLRKLAAHYKLV